ncbi:MAG: SufD family Fe-S cluster assembly protein [Nitrospinae bacterium]|nr:SufD family Fe-S cluster assembly protein [Nitrospinota bacterium]
MKTGVKQSGEAEAVINAHVESVTAKRLNPWLLESNMAGIVRFARLGLPGRKHEMFTYVDLAELSLPEFDFTPEIPGRVDAGALEGHLFTPCRASRIVIVDGIYNAELTDMSTVEGSVRIYGAAGNAGLTSGVCRTLENENDPFASLNGAYFRDLTVIEVAPGETPAAPIEIIYLNTGGQPGRPAYFPRILVKVGAMAHAGIVFKRVSGPGEHFMSAFEEITVAEGGSLKYASVQTGAADSWNFTKTLVTLGMNSFVSTVSAICGARLARNHFEAHLTAPGGRIELNGAAVVNGFEQAHTYVRVVHEAPDCSSAQRFKNIAGGHAAASVDTTVTVREGAHGSTSTQVVNNMVMSNTAVAAVKPNLMIFNDDVKCSHGATVGRFGDEQVLYLRSRGIPVKEALRALTSGFIGEIVNSMIPAQAASAARAGLMANLEG